MTAAREPDELPVDRAAEDELIAFLATWLADVAETAAQQHSSAGAAPVLDDDPETGQ